MFEQHWHFPLFFYYSPWCWWTPQWHFRTCITPVEFHRSKGHININKAEKKNNQSLRCHCGATFTALQQQFLFIFLCLKIYINIAFLPLLPVPVSQKLLSQGSRSVCSNSIVLPVFVSCRNQHKRRKKSASHEREWNCNLNLLTRCRIRPCLV